MGGIILGPYLAFSLVRQNELPILIVAGLALVVFMFGIARDMLCIAPLVGLYLAGDLKLIPGKPSGLEFGAAAVVIYYLIAYAALRRKVVLTGPLYFFVPIMLFAGIIFAHDPHISLGLSGGGREGGRGVVDILVAAIAFVCAVSLNSPSARLFSLTPVFCITALVVTGFPSVMTTYLPKTAEFFYLFTDNINIDAYIVDVVGGTADVVRSGSLAQIGAAVVIFLLCYFPIHTWWRPDRWWIAILAAVCSWFVVSGGFRSEFVSFVLMFGLAVWCHSSWRALTLAPPLIGIIALAVALQNSHLVQLPETAQRTLSFLPGDWDPTAVSSTQSSNEFRERIRNVYLKEEAGKSPWLGNGITYEAADFERYTFLAQTHETEDGYYGTKLFLSAKMFHTGWISAYDGTGFIGCGLLSILAFGLIWVSGKMVFSQTADRGSSLFPLKIWLFVNVTGSVFSFLTVFGAIISFFPSTCAYAAVWVHLNRLEKFGYRPTVYSRMVPFDPERTKLPVPA